MGLRVIFWGNSQSTFSGHHFQGLADVPCELAAVVDVPPSKQGSTNPLPAGLPDFVDVARGLDIPALAPVNPSEPSFIEQIRALAPDLFIAVGYALILKPALLSVPRLLSANFHASLLPHYRGKHPVFWTLRGGERWAGLTVHVMDPGIDTGNIIYQVKVRTRRDDTVASLYGRIMDRSVALVGRLVADADRGAVPHRWQAIGQGSYFSSTTEEDFCIDWTWPAEKIRRHIVMTPGKCFTSLAGRRLYFYRAEKARGQWEAAPGTLLSIGRVRCAVATGEGAVWLGLARLSDGPEQPAAAICRQLGLKPGNKLA